MTIDTENKNRINRLRLLRTAVIAFSVVLATLILYQTVQNFLFPELSMLQSTIITIFIVLVIAIVITFFIDKKHYALISKAQKEMDEREKIYEESLRNLSLLNATIESTTDGILVVDKNGKVSKTNKKFAELWNIPEEIIELKDDEKLLAHILHQLTSPQDFLKKVRDLYEHPAAESYDILEFEDGRVFERFSRPQKLGDEILGRVWSFRDITDRTKVENTIKVSEKTYRAIFENSNDGMFLLTDVFIDCNDSVCKLFDCKKEDIIGKSPLNFSPDIQPNGEKSAESASRKINAAFKGTPQRFYWQHKTKKGKLFDAEVSLTSIFLEGKDVLLAIVRDITERKKSEFLREALYQISEAAYTASDMPSLYKKIHDAVSTLMLAKNFYIAIYDEKTEMISFPYMVDEYDPPYEPKKLGKGLTEYILRKGEATLIDEELDMKLRESGEVEMVGTPTLIWLGVPLKIEGKAIGVIVVQDYDTPVTYGEEEKQILVFVAEQIAQVIERKRNSEAIKIFSEELKELNQTKDKFFSIIAHDLKNPFITIMGFSDILISDYSELNDEERKFYIEEMKKSAELSHDLLQNLLQWSRSQTGRINFNPKNINLLDIVNNNFDLLNNSAERKGIALVQELGSEQQVFADEDMINTVLRNLLTNAIKFSKAGGTVTINNKEHENHLEISIIDTGIGMDENQLSEIFKLENTKSTMGTDNEVGTGLGLILCKEFIEKNKGNIRVESKPGEGSKFIFTLPKAVENI